MRITPTDDPKADANAIYGALSGVAQEQLHGAGSVLPIAAFVRVTGKCELFSVVDDAARTQPEHEASLLNALRDLVTSGKVRAVGWCVDARTTLPGSGAPTDAIVILMEHRSGTAIHCFMPYSHDGTRFTFGRPFSAPGSPQLFIASQGGVA